MGDCHDGLLCGKNNCLDFNPGADPKAWSCCSSSHKCGLGEGDCDHNSDCADGYDCGRNNCKDFHPGAHPKADCCTITLLPDHPLYVANPTDDRNEGEATGTIIVVDNADEEQY